MDYPTYRNYLNQNIVFGCPICKKEGIDLKLENREDIQEAHCSVHGIVVGEGSSKTFKKWMDENLH